MKKALALLLTTVMAAVPVLADTPVNVVVNGKEVELKGVILESRTMIPVRGVMEGLGYLVEWNGETKTATMTSADGKTVITLVNGENSFTVNEDVITPDVPQQIINDRFMLPLRAIGEAIDTQVDWDATSKTAYVTEEEYLEELAETLEPLAIDKTDDKDSDKSDSNSGNGGGSGSTGGGTTSSDKTDNSESDKDTTAGSTDKKPYKVPEGQIGSTVEGISFEVVDINSVDTATDITLED